MRCTRLSTIVLLCLTACRPTPSNYSCGGGDPLADIVVAEASIDELSLWSASFVVGGTDGDGVLRIVSDDGEAFLFNTMVQGSIVGLTAGANTQIAGVTVPIDVEGLSLTARDLVTSYSGVRAGADIIGGAQVRLLESEVGAKLVMGTFTMGFGTTPIAHEQLTLYLFDDPIGTGEVDNDYYYDDDYEDDYTSDDSDDCSGDGVCDAACDIDDDCYCTADGFCDTLCTSDEDCACVDDDNTCTDGCGGSDNDCLPNGWTCADERYGDGVCDEDCGFVDEDC
jgi:hypothetical protein